LDDIAAEASTSGDQPILDLVEEACDLLGFDDAGEAPRHIVEVTTHGYQVLDTRTQALRADVWGSRGDAQSACDALNGVVSPPAYAA